MQSGHNAAQLSDLNHFNVRNTGIEMPKISEIRRQMGMYVRHMK